MVKGCFQGVFPWPGVDTIVFLKSTVVTTTKQIFLKKKK